MVHRATAERTFRRNLVLDAARALFAEYAVAEVSMDDIASASEYTRRTLYNYFGSFDEICLTLYLESLAARWNVQREAILHEDTGMAKLRRWAWSLRDYRADNPHYGSLESYWDYHGVHPDTVPSELFQRFQSFNDELAEGLRVIFRLGISDGTIRGDVDVDLSISLFLHTLRAALRRAESPAYSFARFDREAYITGYLDLLSNGLST